MATTTWLGTTDSDAAKSANWSAGLPGTALFDEDSNDNPCTLTEDTSWVGLNVDGDYWGKIDMAGFDLLLGGITLQGGTTGEFDFGTGKLSITNNVTLGAVGSMVYALGSGCSIEAIGANEQTWDTEDRTVPPIVVAKSGGTLTFTDGWTAASFTLTSGTVDFNGETFETTGDFEITTGGSIVAGNDAMNGVALTVGGTFNAYGTGDAKLNLRGTAGWTLGVAADDVQHADVSYCDASGGVEIAAVNTIDSGGNTNWTFQITVDGDTQIVYLPRTKHGVILPRTERGAETERMKRGAVLSKTKRGVVLPRTKRGILV